jgi:hypothetical protein
MPGSLADKGFVMVPSGRATNRPVPDAATVATLTTPRLGIGRRGRVSTGRARSGAWGPRRCDDAELDHGREVITRRPMLGQASVLDPEPVRLMR